jgi:hypothetical protein
LPVDLMVQMGLPLHSLMGQMGLHLMDLRLHLVGLHLMALPLMGLHLMALHWMCFPATYIVIQLVYRNIVIQPEISAFGFLGCLGYFFLFKLLSLRQLLALCPFFTTISTPHIVALATHFNVLVYLLINSSFFSFFGSPALFPWLRWFYRFHTSSTDHSSGPGI